MMGPKAVGPAMPASVMEAQVVLPQLQSDFYELISTLSAGEQPEVTTASG